MDSNTKLVSSADSPLYVDFFPQDLLHIKGSIGMTFAPGKKGHRSLSMNVIWNRDLDMDLDTLKNVYKTDILISLCEAFEYHTACIPKIQEKCEEKSIINVRFPIVDGSIPKNDEINDYKNLAISLKEKSEQGCNIVIHCMGGIGRTGTLAACILVLFGHTNEKAIELTRKYRKGAIENKVQEEFVAKFEKIFNAVEKN